MGKSPQGILGPTSGKVGPVVFYVVNGQTFSRSIPSKRTGKKSQKEKANTGGFAKVQLFMKPISDYLKVGFKDYGSKTGGYKAAVSYALKNAVEGDPENRVVNPEKVRVCGGELHFPNSAAIELEAENFLRFTWSTEAGDNGGEYDQVFMLAYAPPKKKMGKWKYCAQPTGAFRKVGTDGLQLVSYKKEVLYHIYMGFVARDRSSQAHSVYLGTVTVPARES